MKRLVIYIFLLILTFYSIYLLFKIEMKNEKNEINTIGKINNEEMLPIPTRIIYKNKKEKYIIIDEEEVEFQKIFNELYRRINNVIQGKTYSEDEIEKMQEEGCFIEFDYNRISKNYVFFLENSEVGVIKRTSDGGQVIVSNLDDKENLINKMEIWTEDCHEYDFKKEKNYTFSNILNNIPLNLEEKEVKPEIYQMMLTNYGKGDFKNICKSLGIETTNDLLNFNLNKETIIITLSKYEIQNVKQNIGNIKYTFGNYQDKYSINILIVSKIVNTNCIYYNINNL